MEQSKPVSEMDTSEIIQKVYIPRLKYILDSVQETISKGRDDLEDLRVRLEYIIKKFENLPKEEGELKLRGSETFNLYTEAEKVRTLTEEAIASKPESMERRLEIEQEMKNRKAA
ncbi:MAG: hypothetical protein ABII02_01660 [Candidatus Magasanikbacteria bacterium]